VPARHCRSSLSTIHHAIVEGRTDIQAPVSCNTTLAGNGSVLDGGPFHLTYCSVVTQRNMMH
jgi:hypothetical protein